MERTERFKHKNYKTFEEAQTIWNNDTSKLFSDYLVFYDVDVEKEDTIITIEDPSDNRIDIVLKVLAKGEKCSMVEPNDKVLLNPSIYMSGSIPTMIDDCLFWISPERAVIKICK